LSATVTPTSESPQVSLGALAISGALTNLGRVCYDAFIMKIAALTALIGIFLLVFIGVPIIVLTGVWIPLLVFGVIAASGFFAEMFIFILDP
jgi:hypothetical protein